MCNSTYVLNSSLLGPPKCYLRIYWGRPGSKSLDKCIVCPGHPATRETAKIAMRTPWTAEATDMLTKSAVAYMFPGSWLTDTLTAQRMSRRASEPQALPCHAGSTRVESCSPIAGDAAWTLPEKSAKGSRGRLLPR